MACLFTLGKFDYERYQKGSDRSRGSRVSPALTAPTLTAQLKSPDTVKKALRLLVQVSNDLKRQITNKDFARIPHEYMEYTEAADPLRTGIKDSRPDFKTKMETRLRRQ